MKRLIAVLLTAGLLLLVGCSTDTYSQESTLSTFKLKNVSSIQLAGVNHAMDEMVEVDIYPDTAGTSYNDLVSLVTGKKLDTCPTDQFENCYVMYTINTGETVKIYPANDGSPYICLFTLNPQQAKYLELEQQDFDRIVKIIEDNGIHVTDS